MMIAKVGSQANYPYEYVASNHSTQDTCYQIIPSLEAGTYVVYCQVDFTTSFQEFVFGVYSN